MKPNEEQLDTEGWKDYRTAKQNKKWENKQKSLCLLDDAGIEFECLNEGIGHYRIGWWDFWPTTGKFWNRKTQEKGRGVFELIRKIK